jgi:hypothetical protein
MFATLLPILFIILIGNFVILHLQELWYNLYLIIYYALRLSNIDNNNKFLEAY